MRVTTHAQRAGRPARPSAYEEEKRPQHTRFDAGGQAFVKDGRAMRYPNRREVGRWLREMGVSHA